jgi:hypothetical protein
MGITGFYIIIICIILGASCANKKSLPTYYKFAPIYKEECYAENKSYWLCRDVNVQ